MEFALAGAKIAADYRILDNHALVIAGGRIAKILPVASLDRKLERREVEGLLAPGFIDVQVNGGGGVLFNDTRSVEGIRAIGAAHRKFGTTGFLPTLVTDTREHMAEAMEAARAALAEKVPGLLGIHLEGPFLNPEKKGVHNSAFMRPIEAEDFRIMTALGPRGETLVTLAPEMHATLRDGVIARLTQAGIIVAAGHTMATAEQLEEAVRQGLRGYTHLFNAMPPLAGRAPGPVGAALSERSTFVSIIVDLHHVSVPSLSVALAAKRPEKLMLITDAMPTVGTDLEKFELPGATAFRKNGKLTTADGTLAGSDLDMASAVRNTVQRLGIDLPTALKMASRVPAEFLGLDQELGRIAPGYRANLVLLDGELKAVATWIDGVEEG